MLAEARDTGDARLEGRALRALAMFPQEGRDLRADAERAVELGQQSSEVEAAYAWGGLGWVHLQLGDPMAAARAFRASSDLFRKLGQSVSLSWSESALLHVETTRAGLSERVDALLAPGSVDRLPPAVQINVATILTDTLLDLGRIDEAVAWTLRGMELDALHGSNIRTRATCIGNLGLAALAGGDHPAARRHLEEACQAAEVESARHALYRCEIGISLATEGQLEAALAELDRALPRIPPDTGPGKRRRLWHAAVQWALRGHTPEAEAPEPDGPRETPRLDLIFSGRGHAAYEVVSKVLTGSAEALASLHAPIAGSPLAESLATSLQARLLVDFVTTRAPAPQTVPSRSPDPETS